MSLLNLEEPSPAWPYIKAAASYCNIPGTDLGLNPLVELQDDLAQEQYQNEVKSLLEAMSANTAQIVQTLRESAQLEVTEVQFQEEVRNFSEWLYLKRLADKYFFADFKGIQESKFVPLPLDDIFVDLRTFPEEREYSRIEREQELRQKLDGENVPSGSAFQEELEEMDRHQSQKTNAEGTPPGQMLKDSGPAVLLGGPGSGKTTLVKRLARSCALGRKQMKERFPEMPWCFPVVVPITQYIEHSQGCTVLEYVEFSLRERGGRALLSCYQNYFVDGRVLFLLDGLDEVAQASDRILAAKAVDEAALSLGRNRLLATSRRVGYAICRLSVPASHHILCPFSANDITRFVERWYVAFEKSQKNEKSNFSEAINTANELNEEIGSNESVASLATNPLMLTIIALIKHRSVELPHRRVELYRIALETLLESWNLARSLSQSRKYRSISETTRIEQTREVWSHIAFWMQSVANREVSRGRLHERLVETLVSECDKSEFEAQAIAGSYLDTATETSGLLEARGVKTVAVVHQSCQEYLAGYKLVRPASKACERILVFCHDPRWHEVVRLGVGHLSIAVGEKEVVAEIVQSLLCFDDPLEPFLCSALQLALGCLADQVGLRQFQVDRILLATFRKLDSLSSEIVSSGILGMLSQIDVAPSPAIAREMLELASRNSDWRVRMEAMRLVGRMPSISDELVELLENVLKQEKDIDVSGYAAFCLWRKGIKTKDIFEKALYSEWSAYGTQSSDLSIEEPMDYLIELIQDPDVMVGWCVVDKIKKTNNREGFLSTLLENLQKPNLLARARSAEILLSWGHEDVIEILLGMLGEQDPNVNSSVMQVLTEYSANEKVVRSIRCRINSQEPLVRLRLAELLCDFGMKDEAAPVLSGLFEGGDAGFVLSVAEVLVQLDMAEPVIPVLLELSKIATGSECLRIARVLVSAGGFEASVPIFIEFIGTAKLHSATQQLLMALSILEGAESSAVLIPVLRELLDDASYAVSSRAAAVLNAWGSFDSFLPLMIEEVRNPRFQKRSQWISVFGMWNPRKDTHSVLIELLQDPEKGIQFAAAQVLVRWSVNYQLASPALVDWIVKELMPGSGDELRDAFGASQRLNSSFLKPEVRTQAGILLSVLPDDTKWKKQLRELSLNLVWRHCATTG